MKIAIISDLHLGDYASVLVRKDKQSGKITLGEKYTDFKNAAGTNNKYLLLLGDVLDFAITGYDEAYHVGKVFFDQIKKDEIAEEIIYVPGNHDADIWHIVEHQVNIVYQLANGRLPTKFRMSVPGVIDDRVKSPYRGFRLPGITENTVPRKPKYAGLFLDKITNPPTPFNFAYPNVYMVTDEESVLITHGHYLEPYWTLLSEWVPDIVGTDLKIGDALDLRELVGINFPLNQLASSGVGQADPLTQLINAVMHDVKEGKYSNIEKYLNNLDTTLDDKVFDYSWYDPSEALTDSLSNFLKGKILEAVKSIKDTRYSEEFIYKKDVLQRFKKYYTSSIVEIDELNAKYNCSLSIPSKVVFGHTHQPIPWNSPDAPKTQTGAGNIVKLFNTGGWLTREKNGKTEFCGAEVITYESGKGFKSYSIR